MNHRNARRYTYLIFECCGNEIRVGRGGVGNHSDVCFACDTDNPDVRREVRYE